MNIFELTADQAKAANANISEDDLSAIVEKLLSGRVITN
jgi:hypothetical protein